MHMKDARAIGIKIDNIFAIVALLIHRKSPAAYETLRGTGVVVLPSGSTLRDYSDFLYNRGDSIIVVNVFPTSK